MTNLQLVKRQKRENPCSEPELSTLRDVVKSQMLQLDSLSQLMNQVDESESFSLDLAFFHGLSKFLKSMSEISSDTLDWLDNVEMSSA